MAYTSALQPMMEGSHSRDSSGSRGRKHRETLLAGLLLDSHAATFPGEPRPIFLWMAPAKVDLALLCHYNQENAPIDIPPSQTNLIGATLQWRVSLARCIMLGRKQNNI